MIGIISFSEYKVLSAIELLIAIGLYIHCFERRDHFLFRAIGSIGVILLVAWLFPVPKDNVFWVFFYYIMLFSLVLLAMRFCFQGGWRNLLFCLISAYLLKHLAYILFNMLNDFIGRIFHVDNGFNPYYDTNSNDSEIAWLISVPCYVLSYFLTYWFGYYLCASKVKPTNEMNLGRIELLLIAGAVLVFALIFSLLMSFNENKDIISTWVERGYGVLSCFVVLGLQFSKLNEAEVRDDLSKVRNILTEEQRQYILLKQNMDFVNIKCHDIKHMIGAFRSKVGVYEDEISKIEDSVSALGTIVMTGNETLDMVLTEKTQWAEVEGVTVGCIADGKLLGFMKPSDIYSLVGNALENAIQAVKKEDEKYRTVSFFLRQVNGLTVIHVENYFTGKLKFVDGLPQTTSNDRVNHGYGMLSIRTIVESYGGVVAVEVEEDVDGGSIFMLNIFFPQQQNEIDSNVLST